MKGFVRRHDGYSVARNRLNKDPLHTAGVRINSLKKQDATSGRAFIKMPRFQIGESELGDGLILKQIAQTVRPRTHLQCKASDKNRDQQRYHSHDAKNPHGAYAAGKKRGHFGIGIAPPQPDDNEDVKDDRQEGPQGDGGVDEDEREDSIGGQQTAGNPVQVTDGRKVGVEKKESGAENTLGFGYISQGMSVEGRHGRTEG